MLFVWMLACTGEKESAEPEGCTGEPTVEIGDGNDPFVAIAAESSHVMTHGPQGGWHMLASVRTTNTDDIVSIHYTIEVLPEMTLVSDNKYRVQLKDVGNCQGTYWNMYGYLDATPLASGDLDTPPELLCGKTLRLTMEVYDSEERGGATSVDVEATNDPVDTCGAP